MRKDADARRIERLMEALENLTERQISLIEEVVNQFRKPFVQLERLTTSDIVNDSLLQDFGDALRIHHCFSKEPFTKDKFEYALEKISNLCGHKAKLAPKGNPGHDITINEQRFSLKTEASKAISTNKLHISKFMELGKGTWTDEVEHLKGLCEQFFRHTEAYDRILSLRCLSQGRPHWHYELMEIPMALLHESRLGSYRIQSKSKQQPKPGYCDVVDKAGNIKLQLYFDGGTERKLQIKNLQKSLCIVHATWVFIIA